MVHKRTHALLPALCLVLTCASGGCFRPVLTADDVVVRPDGTTTLIAHLEAETWPIMRKDLRGQVRFLVNQEPLGEARAIEGAAVIDRRLPDNAETYLARSSFLGLRQKASGRVFRWQSDRVTIVVDIDETICDTDTSEVLFRRRDRDSSPIPGSQPTLEHLAQAFQIAYLTARPRALFNKTKIWLADHHFPAGPVFVAPGLKKMMRQTHYKTVALESLRSTWPNIAIGIGNTNVDAKAYSDNGMLPIIIENDPDHDLDRHAMVLRDWAEVDRFFAKNRDVLSDPARLRRILESGGSFVVPFGPSSKPRD